MNDIVICGLARCRKSFKSRFRLKLHMFFTHHHLSELYYIADIPPKICKNPKYCKYFYLENEDKVKLHVTEEDLDMLINKDTYILSHMHNSQFKRHLLIIMIGKEYTLPDGPFLQNFELYGTILRAVVSVEDLQYLKEDLQNNVLEFDQFEENLPTNLWLIPDLD